MSTRRFTHRDLHGRTVRSADGASLGTVDGILEDDAGAPRYLEVTSGWFGTRRHALPLDGLALDDDGDLLLPYPRTRLETGPTLGDGEHLTYDRERAVGAHYGAQVRAWDDARDDWLPADDDLVPGPTPAIRDALETASDEARDPTAGDPTYGRGATRAHDSTMRDGWGTGDDVPRGRSAGAGAGQDDPHAVADHIPGRDLRMGGAAPDQGAIRISGDERRPHDPRMSGENAITRPDDRMRRRVRRWRDDDGG